MNDCSSLKQTLPFEIQSSNIQWNLSAEKLAQIVIDNGEGIRTSTGALNIATGEFTGRSPKDRFIVKDNITATTVWWNQFNIPFEADAFDILYQKMLAYLSNKTFYVRDAYACADSRYRTNIRAITELASSNLFVHNMFLRPTKEELKNFNPEWTIICIPSFKANPKVDKTRQHNFSIINFTKKILLVGGTGYTGEIKKGIFSVLNFVLPTEKNVLSMHCSANMGKKEDTAIFFGLSGTGKTTLSADPNRSLIGDDEHGWAEDNTIFNFEGGCYAKTINLTKEKEPDIFNAIRIGAVLENVVCDKTNNEANYKDMSITENTRVSYPIHHIQNIVRPSIGKNLKNIFFLTCDAYGVLPPLAKLSPEQAAFHFISGYTAKVAGTETGIVEPTTTFSACFGAPFMPLHPAKYASMLMMKMKMSHAKVWLVNTGWSKGSYGTGERIKLSHTRAVIKAVLDGNMDNINYNNNNLFRLDIPESCPGVPASVLHPRNTWNNKEDYDAKAKSLALQFNKNFEYFAEIATEEILKGAPCSTI